MPYTELEQFQTQNSHGFTYYLTDCRNTKRSENGLAEQEQLKGITSNLILGNTYHLKWKRIKLKLRIDSPKRVS